MSAAQSIPLGVGPAPEAVAAFTGLQPRALISVIARYYKRHPHLPHCGYVVVYKGAPCGWMAGPNNASNWVPGCVAVSPQAQKSYIAIGGYKNQGAHGWIEIRPEGGQS